MRKRYWVLVIAMVLASGLMQVVYHRGIEPTLVVEAQAAHDQMQLEMPLSPKKARRVVYRYALVPKGVHSMGAFYQALTDPAVLQAYSEVNVGELHFERLKTPFCGYVAFKRAGFVQWTTHCIVIKSGEEVLTDGHHMILARCGNLVSLLPRTPEGSAGVQVSTLDNTFPVVSQPAPSLADGLPAATVGAPPETTAMSYLPTALTPIAPPTTSISIAPPASSPCCVGVGVTPANPTTHPVSLPDGDDSSVIMLAALMFFVIGLKLRAHSAPESCGAARGRLSL